MIIMVLIIIFIKKCVFRARVFRRTLETRRTLEFYWISSLDFFQFYPAGPLGPLDRLEIQPFQPFLTLSKR